MNNQQAKEILSAYRPDGSDAQDENFKKALEQCRRDPELQAWFSDQVQFDAFMARKLREVRGPDEGKLAVLASLNMEVKQAPRSGWRRAFPYFSIGLAAIFLLSVGLFNILDNHKRDEGFNTDNFSVTHLVGEAMPLDHRSSNRAELETWLADRNAPVPPKLPEIFELATAEGCRVFEDGNGGKVSLFCFTMDGEFVHVLTFDDQTRQYLNRPKGEWWSEGKLNMIAFEKDQRLYAIATGLPAEKFSKYM